MNKPPLTVTEVCALPSGDKDRPTWINSMTALIKSLERKSSREGKTYYSVVLTDGKTDIYMSLWSAPPFAAAQQIEISGQGTRLTEFQGRRQITPSQKTVFTVISPGKPDPKLPSETPVSNPEVRAKNSRVCGQTAGMAIKLAAEVLRDKSSPDDQFWSRLEEAARKIIALSARLQSGNAINPDKVVSAKEAEDEDVPF